MLKSIVKNTEWERLFNLLPSFFDVLPAATLWGESRRLLSNYMHEGRFKDVLLERDRSLADKQLPVVVRAHVNRNAPKHNPVRSGMTARERGQKVLQLYFHQLFTRGPTVLDLRHDRFVENGETLVWTPKPAYVQFDPGFKLDVQRLYAGFFREDDAMFTTALRALHLLEAKDLFLEHFGDAQHQEVDFTLKHFQQTFTRVFARCEENHARLHGDFLPFGLYMATLYDHLEILDVPLDARAAFESVFDPAAMVLEEPASAPAHRASGLWPARLSFRS